MLTHKSGLTPCITCISIKYSEDYRSRHMLVQTSSSPVKFISTNIYQNISNSCDLVRLSSTEMKNSNSVLSSLSIQKPRPHETEFVNNKSIYSVLMKLYQSYMALKSEQILVSHAGTDSAQHT